MDATLTANTHALTLHFSCHHSLPQPTLTHSHHVSRAITVHAAHNQHSHTHMPRFIKVQLSTLTSKIQPTLTHTRDVSHVTCHAASQSLTHSRHASCVITSNTLRHNCLLPLRPQHLLGGGGCNSGGGGCVVGSSSSSSRGGSSSARAAPQQTLLV